MKRRAAKPLPSAEFLRERFAYNPSTGILTRRIYPGMRKCDASRYDGRQAGHVTDEGYIQVGIGKRLVLAHRVIWKMVTGDEPPDEIDHRDGDTTNNRFGNFRAATHQQNVQNKSLKAGKSLPLGVHASRSGLIEVRIRRERYTGFASVDVAAEFYKQKSIELFGEFAKLASEEA